MANLTLVVNLRLLNPGQIGGMETYVRFLLDRWIGGAVGQGISWILLTNERNHATFDHLGQSCQRMVLPEPDHENFIRARLLEIQPDVYFCPLLALEPLDPPCLSAVTIPDLQHEFFPEFFSVETLDWRHKTFGPSVRNASCVLTISEYSKKTFVEKLGLPPEKVHATHLEVDPIFRHPVDPSSLPVVLRKYNIPDCYLFYPANFWPHKNHETLLRAFALALQEGNSLNLVLTGATDNRVHLVRRLACDLKIDSRVHYIGYVPKGDLPYLYRGAQALVFPSLFEGFGIPIAEAFSCGCPVICSNTTSCPEVAQDGALLVDPAKPEEIAEAITEVCRDESLRNRLIEAGSRVALKIAENRLAETTLECLLQVIDRHERRPTTRSLPRMTVVTPSYNQGEFISDTIRSVLDQNYPDLDYWVMDGGSTDQTVEILKSFGLRIRWVSEKDRGQADAINKGFERAKGEVLCWLNSDDTFLPGTLEYVGNFFAGNPDVDVVYGNGYYIDRGGRFMQPYRTFDYAWETLIEECYICQPTVFFRSRVLEDVGMLDASLHFALDYDLWLRVFRKHHPVRLPRFLATSRLYSENKTLSQRTGVYQEIFRTVGKHNGFVPYSWVLGYANFLYHRNNQITDLRPINRSQVILAKLLMVWQNRNSPRRLLHWLRRS